jgi:glycosyltransferase involved in cell wall biosynthesis
MPVENREIPGRILYVGASLPARSETFVYREVFALCALGLDVRTASVHPPQRGLGEARLDQLADDAIGIYGPGMRRLLTDAALESMTHPIRKIRTALTALCDAIAAPDVAGLNRPKIIWQMLGGLALARRVRRLGIQHIHSHMAHVPTTIAMYAAVQLGVPFSFTGHAADIFRSRTLLKAKLQRAAFAACISHWHRQFYRSIVVRPDDRYPIVRCGVDISEFSPQLHMTRERPGGDASSPAAGPRATRVLAVGRLVPKKGFDLLLHALAMLRDGGETCRATIVGEGPELQDLQRLRTELQLDHEVALVGAKSNQQVRDMFREADLFVLPCRIDQAGDRDGIPVVLMEAMASGVCCVSGDLPAIRELIDDGVSGRLVTPGEVEPLVAAMRELISSADLREVLAREGRRRVEEEFSLALNAERMAESLRNATARWGAAQQNVLPAGLRQQEHGAAASRPSIAAAKR